MSKMSELSAILDEMIECGSGLAKAATSLKEYYSSTEEVKSEPNTKQPEQTKESKKEVTTASSTNEKTYTHEEVRALLSKKANESEGKFKAVVKGLVKKYADGGTLKDISPEKYAALVAELEVFGNV